MNSAGVIYDPEAADRMRDLADRQAGLFSDSEKDTSLKEWILIGGIIVVSAVGLILVAKKLIR